MIDLREFKYEACADRVQEIYQLENWLAYLQDLEKLQRAFAHSLYCLGAFDGEKLVGFARCVGDGEHIVLVQDLIIDRAYQRQGIGTRLFKAVWEHYAHVRMFHVVTDLHDKVDNHFYQSMGMKKLEAGEMVSYFR